MSRKRVPVAEVGAENYRIVRHTHDVELATTLMRGEMIDQDGCPIPEHIEWPGVCTAEPAAHDFPVGDPKQVYVRVIPALPDSFAESEGWSFEYRECEPGRGAFPAVVFRA